MGIIAALITRISTYTSDLIKITDDIYIPKAVGQSQYGAARFYKKDELPGVFDVINISHTDSLIKKLMQQGYDDLDFYDGR